MGSLAIGILFTCIWSVLPDTNPSLSEHVIAESPVNNTRSQRFLFGRREFHIPPDIKKLLPDSAIGTDHVRFDLLKLHGHTDVIKKLYEEHYKFCLGCAYFDDDNQCHSVEVCDRDALCINGSFPENIHWTVPGIFQLNTDPWYGCCKPGDKCMTDHKNVTIHIANLYPVNFEYKLQTCDDLLCNAGAYFMYHVREFRNMFRRQTNSMISPSSTTSITIQSTSADDLQQTMKGFQMTSNIKPTATLQTKATSLSTPSVFTTYGQSTSTIQLRSTPTITVQSTQMISSSMMSTLRPYSLPSVTLHSTPSLGRHSMQPMTSTPTINYNSNSNMKMISTQTINLQSSRNIQSTSKVQINVTPSSRVMLLSSIQVFTASPRVAVIGALSSDPDMTKAKGPDSTVMQNSMPANSSLPISQFQSASVSPAMPVATRPPTAVKCAVCTGPPQACDLAYREVYCHPPNNYCINHVINMASGERLVERKCGDFQTCYRDWYHGTSDDDKCRQFSSSKIMTYRFECTYCCVKDSCNVDLRPPRDTLYTTHG